MSKLTMWQEWQEASRADKLKAAVGLAATLVGFWWLFTWAIPTYLHGALQLSPPPTGAGFLYSVGWYAAEIFSAIENLFR